MAIRPWWILATASAATVGLGWMWLFGDVATGQRVATAIGSATSVGTLSTTIWLAYRQDRKVAVVTKPPQPAGIPARQRRLRRRTRVALVVGSALTALTVAIGITVITMRYREPEPQGLLSASLKQLVTRVDLSREGTIDWTHWGGQPPEPVRSIGPRVAEVCPTNPDCLDRRAGAGQIGPLGHIGDSDVILRDPQPVAFGFGWDDGWPAASATNVHSGLAVTSPPESGFSLTAPTAQDGQSSRTLRLYFAASGSQIRVHAWLSDHSAGDIDLVVPTVPAVTRILAITYGDRFPVQTLNVAITVERDGTGHEGSLLVYAATLS